MAEELALAFPEEAGLDKSKAGLKKCNAYLGPNLLSLIHIYMELTHVSFSEACRVLLYKGVIAALREHEVVQCALAVAKQRKGISA